MKLGPQDDSTTPVIEPAKRTTQVNIAAVIAVLVFLLVGLFAWKAFFRG